MTIRVHLFQNNREFFAYRSEAVDYLYSNMDRLHAEPDESMAPVVEDIKQALGIDVQPCVLSSFDIEGSEEDVARAYDALFSIAVKHALLVLWDNSGAIFNFTGEPIFLDKAVLIRNSAGAQWWQVTPATIHAAFEDALRWPNPHVTAFISNPEPVTEFGSSVTIALNTEGRYEVVLRGDVWARSVQVDSIDAAVDLMLLWADQNPILLEEPWEVRELEALGMMHPAQRAETQRSRDIGAVFNQPHGAAVRLWDFWPTSWLQGTTPDGQIYAALTALTGPQSRKSFTSTDDLMQELQAAGAGQVTLSRENGWVSETPAFELDVFTVTAMVLPEREYAWSDTSILAFHHKAETAEGQPSAQMMSFVDAVNERSQDHLILAESEVEAKELTRIMVPAETVGITLERLQFLASSRRVSLVLNGTHVIHNPGAHTGQPSFVMELRGGGEVLRSFNGTETSQVATALRYLSLSYVLNVSTPVIVPADRAYELALARTDNGTITVLLESPSGRHTLDEVTPMVASNFITLFVQDPEQFANNVRWTDESAPHNESAEDARYLYQDSAENSGRYERDVVVPLVQQQALSTLGSWVVIHDLHVKGDYCQIDRVGEKQFVVEWGHDFGKLESFQHVFDNLDDAMNRWLEFTTGDVEAFSQLEWKRVD